MASTADTGKTYHRECTGEAYKTAQAHISPKDITLFASCFCPFVQRIWVALEFYGIDYRLGHRLRCFDLDEVDPYKKPADLLEVSPKGLVPALRLETYKPPRAVNESTVILEFLEDLASSTVKRSLLPPVTDPYARVLIRLQLDHVNRTLVPAFYRFIQAQEESQIQTGKEFVQAIDGLVKLFQRAAQETNSSCGLWSDGGELSLTDVMVAPWLFRATNVLAHYRGFMLPEGPQFRSYMERLLNYPAFKRTCSTADLYIDSYER
ncbi:uncharacterized protein FIBRA_01415 [Fibroporia radiculosa]|uniref:GST C-terminal domain-containing protein n=1 Tax=Fibroporia radiculosa TaxID=599839 RepID=J4HTB4_9APHY|nr:uncharacterized protein FIBRA_01415 [Fibroporia radiculosa]CCL99397.1 predicted protein [Fibroporia radiculosa]